MYSATLTTQHTFMINTITGNEKKYKLNFLMFK